MKERVVHTVSSSRLTQASALCVAGALSLAVFYHGPQIPLLAGAQFLLIAWVVLSLMASYSGIRMPLTPVSVTLSLFWLWLGISLGWSAVPVTSIINFWWVGSLVLTFWAFTLSPERGQLWSYLARFAVVGALGLCAYALVQLSLWRLPPRSTFVNIHSFAALMMLIALPLGGYFLRAWYRHARPKVLYALGASLFMLFFTIATTEGRGTALSILLGMAVLAALSLRTVGTKPVITLLGLLLGAYATANLLLHGGFGASRLTTLIDPASAGVPRFLIWRGSWELLMANPWWGIGLGTYYLAWPPYRDPADETLGFFVHNDYLQLWIEAGLPAVVLLLGVFAGVLIMFARLLRHARFGAAARLEALGLFAGLLAVAAHSFVDFNLYILPISIGAGLVLGRLHQCAAEVLRPRAWMLQPMRLVQLRAYRIIVVLLALFPLSYFAALGVSDYLYKRGFALAAAGMLVEADDAFTWAERLLPGDDKVLTMHADLYRHVLGRLPRANQPERVTLYHAALEMLQEAESANPYRPLVHSVRGRLLHEHPDLAGADWRARVEAAYTKALALDPRFFATRMAYAHLLIDAGREEEAMRILRAGLKYWYYPGPPVLAYLELTAQVARRAGDHATAADVERRLAEVRTAIAAMAPVRPVVPDITPATASAI